MSQLLLIKTLKYTEYSWGFEYKIWNKISRRTLETEFLEVPFKKVMPKAVQIFSREGTEGTISLRYQEEMVDWGKPERSAK